VEYAFEEAASVPVAVAIGGTCWRGDKTLGDVEADPVDLVDTTGLTAANEASFSAFSRLSFSTFS
jgi:hypothetical protein